MQENNIPVTQLPSEPVIHIEQQPKQSNFLVILLSILLIISIAIAVFFVFQTQRLVNELRVMSDESKQTVESTTEPVATIDPTADWKTYTNNEFEFQMKYPPAWKLEVDQSVATKGNREFRFKTEKNEYINGVVFDGPTGYIQKLEDWEKKINMSNGDSLFISYTDNLGPGSKGAMIDINIFNHFFSTFKFINSSDASIPKSISSLFDSINSNFKLNLVPVEENKFYSSTGEITKKSWKIDLKDANLGKSFTTYLLTLLRSLDAESGGIGGGGIDAYENNSIKCYHSFMSQGPDIHNYLSCAEK